MERIFQVQGRDWGAFSCPGPSLGSDLLMTYPNRPFTFYFLLLGIHFLCHLLIGFTGLFLIDLFEFFFKMLILCLLFVLQLFSILANVFFESSPVPFNFVVFFIV